MSTLPNAASPDDLDALIARLQALRSEHGNLPVATQLGLQYVGPLRLSVARLAAGPKPTRLVGRKLVSRGGMPIVLVGND